MGVTLTDDEVRILTSRFQAGAAGHRQRVIAHTRVRVEPDFTNPRAPWAVQMLNGQAGVIFRGDPIDPLVFGNRVYFLRYDTEHSGVTMELFPYDTYAYGLVRWNNRLLAVCYRPSDGALRYRTSQTNGQTWSDEAGLGITLVAANVVSVQRPSFQLTTNREGTVLFMFYMDGTSFPANVLWRQTSNANPTLGWTAEDDTDATVPSIGRNFGGSFAYNQGLQRTFAMCETATDDLWAIACEADDGDFHANHMVATGTLGGGGFSRTLLVGFGGGLSGNQGANGGLMLDFSDRLLYWVMEDGGDSAFIYRSNDSGTTWTSGTQMMPPGTAYGEGLGIGCGVLLPGYNGDVYIIGGESEFGGGGPPPAFSIGAIQVGRNLELLPNWEPINVPEFWFGSQDIDLSDRVVSIGTNSSVEMQSDSCDIVLANTDQALSMEDTSAMLYDVMQPGTGVTVSQWHGDVANEVTTFTGKVEEVNVSDNEDLVTFRCQDEFYRLLNTDIMPSAPQEADQDGAVLDMGNLVYINKSVNEVLDNLLQFWGSILPQNIDLDPSATFVFALITFQSGSVGDALVRTANEGGLRIWADRMGIIRTESFGNLDRYAYWFFRSDVDVLTLEQDISADESFTHFRVFGADAEGNTVQGDFEATAFWQEFGQARTKMVRDLNARSVEEATFIARSLAMAFARFKRRKVVGIVGHPGLEKMDRVTIQAPRSGILADYRVLSLRQEQDARAGTYVGVMVVEPFDAVDVSSA